MEQAVGLGAGRAGGTSPGLDDLRGKRDTLLVVALESAGSGRENLRRSGTLRVDRRERRACNRHSRSWSRSVARPVRKCAEAHVMVDTRVCLHVALKVIVDVRDRAGGSGDKAASGTLRRRREKTRALSLDASVFELGGTEVAGGRSLLLEHLLLMSVRVANLDRVLFSARLGDHRVVEGLDDFLADIASLEAMAVSLR
jgi:hypothetical protein